MLHATISADIVASSSLTTQETAALNVRIEEIFTALHKYQSKNSKEELVGRHFAGDAIEFFVPRPGDALRVALILKSGIKSLRPDESEKYDKERKKLRKLFEMYGVRIAIGIGDMDESLLKQDIFKGSAINLSGRLVSEQKTSNKERVTVKNTLFFASVDDFHTRIFQPVMSLLDTLFNRMTSRQSEIIYLKLLGSTEAEIALKYGISQSSVNQHSTSAGWNSIEDALNLFSTFDFND
jgi:hypothetical protein